MSGLAEAGKGNIQILTRIFAPVSLILILVLVGLALAQLSGSIDDRGIQTIAPVIDPVTDGVVNIARETERPLQLNPRICGPLFRGLFDIPQRQPQETRRQISVGSKASLNRLRRLAKCNAARLVS